MLNHNSLFYFLFFRYPTLYPTISIKIRVTSEFHARKKTGRERYWVYRFFKAAGCDLMSITRNLLICVWNILRYSLRIWNGKQKTHDTGKIAHYAELAWTMSEGKVIKIDM